MKYFDFTTKENGFTAIFENGHEETITEQSISDWIENNCDVSLFMFDGYADFTNSNGGFVQHESHFDFNQFWKSQGHESQEEIIEEYLNDERKHLFI